MEVGTVLGLRNGVATLKNPKSTSFQWNQHKDLIKITTIEKIKRKILCLKSQENIE